MPRVIVTTDPSTTPAETAVLLDESVHPVHLSTGFAAAQLVERIAWAISDAEEAEHVGDSVRRARAGAEPRTRAHTSRDARTGRSAQSASAQAGAAERVASGRTRADRASRTRAATGALRGVSVTAG